ncbi:hypothetical protein HYH03_015111 [Edaphochlamys debaryana]|uniref:Uncharacterized protein n=1 Tax=Edaphochlamys debaryana TaxID=47281 RepID=A0A836BRH5_9CHLO|nr:hypothetical protein HYH03_015111 [Edaphochlamys debaryana]|eukprot:KAG2486147.1 hypothetical protein HYH03_015111 [Edaphochlamys debaryana]
MLLQWHRGIPTGQSHSCAVRPWGCRAQRHRASPARLLTVASAQGDEAGPADGVRRRRPPARATPVPNPAPAPAAPAAPAPEPLAPGYVGRLRLNMYADISTAYLTGADTIRALLPAQVAAAVAEGVRNQPVALHAAVGPGGALRRYEVGLLWLCRVPGTAVGEWRLSPTLRLAQDMGLQHGERLEAWVLPGGDLELRRAQQAAPTAAAVAAAASAAAAAPPPAPVRQARVRPPVFEVVPAGEAEAELTGYLGQLSLAVGDNKVQMRGATGVQAAWPEAVRAGREARANQGVQLLARRPGDGRVLAYNLQLLWRTNALSSVSAMAQDLGLQRHGDKLALWRRTDGRVEAVREEEEEEA